MIKRTVTQHEHLAGANIPADWNGREMIAAETMMRLAVQKHWVQCDMSAIYQMAAG